MPLGINFTAGRLKCVVSHFQDGVSIHFQAPAISRIFLACFSAGRVLHAVPVLVNFIVINFIVIARIQ